MYNMNEQIQETVTDLCAECSALMASNLTNKAAKCVSARMYARELSVHLKPHVKLKKLLVPRNLVHLYHHVSWSQPIDREKLKLCTKPLKMNISIIGKQPRSLDSFCPFGAPLIIPESGNPFLCGNGAGQPTCPTAFECNVQTGKLHGR